MLEIIINDFLRIFNAILGEHKFSSLSIHIIRIDVRVSELCGRMPKRDEYSVPFCFFEEDLVEIAPFSALEDFEQVFLCDDKRIE